MTHTPKELLGKAAEYLAENGWTQGAFESNTGEVCADGALTAVSQCLSIVNMEDYYSLLTTARKILALEICKEINGQSDLSRYADTERQSRNIRSIPNYAEDYVWSWNDTTGRSKEEVILMMKRAAYDS